MGRFKTSSILFALAIAPFFLAMFAPGLFAGWYPQCARFVVHILSKITGIVPFALAELCLYALITALIFYIILAAKRRAGFKRTAAVLLNWAGALLLAAVWLYGISYFCPTPSERMGLIVEPVSADALKQTAEYYRDMLNEISVDRDSGGNIVRRTFKQYNQAVINGYTKLAGIYDFIMPNPAPAKGLALSIVQSYLGISGIYSPWTAEGCINTDTPAQNLPATIAHELAHRQGAAPEDEANFIGVMACLSSGDPYAEYSGAFLAFTYLSNALGKIDGAARSELWEKLNPEIIADLTGVREHYVQYEGPVNNIGEAVNDTYLKAMQQSEGTESYGMVVDLLIAAYNSNIPVG